MAGAPPAAMTPPSSGSPEPVLDAARFLLMGEGGHAAAVPIRRAVADLVMRGQAPWRQVRDALGGHDWAEARRQLHALRGSWGSFGALRLASRLRVLEDTLAAGQGPRCAEQVADCDLLVAATLEALAQWSTRFPPPASAPALATEPLALASLRVQLQRGEFAALEAFVALKPALSERLGVTETERIDDLLRQFRFADALAALEATDASA